MTVCWMNTGAWDESVWATYANILSYLAGYLLSILPTDPNIDRHYTMSIPNALVMEYMCCVCMNMSRCGVHVCTLAQWSDLQLCTLWCTIQLHGDAQGEVCPLSTLLESAVSNYPAISGKEVHSRLCHERHGAHVAPVREGIYCTVCTNKPTGSTDKALHFQLLWYTVAESDMSQHIHQTIKHIYM